MVYISPMCSFGFSPKLQAQRSIDTIKRFNINLTFILTPPFVNKTSNLLGDKRPLNTLEIGEVYGCIERNAIGLILLMGLIQVTKDKEIKDYFLKGKKLAEKQIHTFNKLIRENDNFIGFPLNLEVTNSTTSPFSEKLMLFFICSSNQIAISTLGYALSITMRKDLAAQWSLIMAEIMGFGGDGIKILVERGWMEKPPQPIDRNEFYKS
ncbi:DUF3231 family protein [Neobacillus mesonae]|uniref:DUF3231 family protein n=1 Tax=Neobacillus mesonae TaxID=1193713 RepID=UPI0033064914